MIDRPLRNIEKAKEALRYHDKKEYEQLLRDMVVYTEWVEAYADKLSEQLAQYAQAYLATSVTVRMPLR